MIVKRGAVLDDGKTYGVTIDYAEKVVTIHAIGKNAQAVTAIMPLAAWEQLKRT